MSTGKIKIRWLATTVCVLIVFAVQFVSCTTDNTLTSSTEASLVETVGISNENTSLVALDSSLSNAFTSNETSEYSEESTVIEIDSRAFNVCPNTMIIYGYAGSYAKVFAREEGIVFKAIGTYY